MPILRRYFAFTLCVGLTAIRLGSATASAQSRRPQVVLLSALKPRIPVERTVTRRVTLQTQIVVARNQYIQIDIDVNGTRTAGRLFAAGGQLLGEIPEVPGYASRRLCFVSRVDGALILRLDSRPTQRASTTVRLTLADPRPATATDALRVSAQQAFVLGLTAWRALPTNLAGARTALERSAALWREAGDARQEARTLQALSAVHQRVGDLEVATRVARRSVELFRSVGDAPGEASMLNDLGKLEFLQGAEGADLSAQTDALAIWQAISDPRGEAVTETQLGRHFDGVNEPDKAIEHFQNALRYFASTGEYEGLAITYLYLGEHYYDLGMHQKSVDNLTESLKFARLLGDPWTEVQTRQNLGVINNTLGEYALANEQLRLSLDKAHLLGDRSFEASVLMNLGTNDADQHNPDKALVSLEAARELFRSLGDVSVEPYLLMNLATVYHDLGRLEDAFTNMTAAHEIFHDRGQKRGELISVTNLGRMLCEIGRCDDGLQRLHEAVDFARSMNDAAQEAVALKHIARSEADLGRLHDAYDHIDAAQRRIELMRTDIVREDLRRSYLALARPTFERKVAILMRLHALEPGRGWDAMAFETSELARARSLLDVIPGLRTAADEHLSPALRQERDDLVRRVRSASAADTTDLLADYYRVQARIRATSPRYAELNDAKPFTLAELRESVGPGEVALEYLLGESRSDVWALTSAGLTHAELPGRSRLEAAVSETLRLLRERVGPFQSTATEAAKRATLIERDRRYWRAAGTLSDMILAPVADAIRGRKVYVIADGALQLVPFAALPHSSVGLTARPEPLVVTNEIVSLPSLSVLSLLRQASRRSVRFDKVAVFADPVYEKSDFRFVAQKGRSILDAPTASKAAAGEAPPSALTAALRGIPGERGAFARLGHAKDELSAIAGMVQPGSLARFEGFDATRQAALNRELEQYHVIHFATHGLLHRRPELSGLVLSLFDERGHAIDGFLQLVDVYGMHLSADLIVLSACDSGLGNDVSGDGIIGLTRGFLLAGATRVLSSLWSVNDTATKDLMTAFYEGLLRDGLSPSASLRQAQIRLWKSEPSSAPYFWAGFTLFGAS